MVGTTTSDSEVSETVAQLHTTVDAVSRLHESNHQRGTRDLAALTREVLALLQVAETAAVSLVAEAIQRGMVHESTAAGPAQWVSRLSTGEDLDRLLPPAATPTSGPLMPLVDCPDEDVHHDPPDQSNADTCEILRLPGVEPLIASRIAKVATACTQRRNTVLAAAVTANSVGVAAARTALIEVDKVIPVLPSAHRDAVFGHFLNLPAGSGSKAIRELAQRVIATYADETFLNDLDERLDHAESVTWSELPNGMHRLVADLAPTHAAHVRHAINALSAPTPGNSCCEDVFHRHTSGQKTGEPDPRQADKRAADALVLLLTRGAEAIDNGATPTSGTARLVVTIDLDVLVGNVRGCGRTEAGTSLNASQIREIACDAEILPMVLGSGSQPLDVGRSERLVTRGLRAAVIQRDRCCTYPGCDRPPSWCQVHHIIPWSHGGPTSLTNSALLCQRHHTIVHRDEYTATATASTVIWDLRPRSMRQPNAAA
ncbi:HNH endonuclease signature motif containing protein [Demetria terragena]|uniref:HNH endonuclease signature motif containing protein n=1 Tax=Demetria terragena TaxID=63959 RepID=UPI000363E845|nr:HNH endonuclease signature motif containing protein [Demetria terragena]